MFPDLPPPTPVDYIVIISCHPVFLKNVFLCLCCILLRNLHLGKTESLVYHRKNISSRVKETQRKKAYS